MISVTWDPAQWSLVIGPGLTPILSHTFPPGIKLVTTDVSQYLPEAIRSWNRKVLWFECLCAPAPVKNLMNRW